MSDKTSASTPNPVTTNLVTKRLVFYCPGYDPEAGTRYRRLLAIALGQTRKHFGVERTIGPVEADDTVPALRWRVTARGPAWQTETIYEVLRWDDLVKRDLDRGWRERIPILLGCIMGVVLEGSLLKLFRLDWRFASMAVFPWVAVFLTVLAAIASGLLAAWLLQFAGMRSSNWGLAIAGLAVAMGAIAALHPVLRRALVYGMLDDWIFNCQHGNGPRPDTAARLDRFATRIIDAMRGSDAQEVLIVGHSTGSIFAVEVAARIVAATTIDDRRRPALVLLTIGAQLPLAGLQRRATKFREAIVRLATAPSILWVEYQAPQDVLNANRFEPVRDLGLDLAGAPQTNPQIRSPRFAETMAPEAYRRMKWQFLRMHFQFLMPVDVPGEYDFPMIVCGPVTLADRIRDPLAAVRAAYGDAAVSGKPVSERSG